MCHIKHTELKLSDRVFVCPACGHTEDRDLHAAQNIKRFGLQQISEQAGIACNVKCSSRTKLPRSSVRAKDSASTLNGSLEAHARVGSPTWRVQFTYLDDIDEISIIESSLSSHRSPLKD
jgi:putative transposase